MHRLLIDGAAIAYIDSGSAEGGNPHDAGHAPILLFIHGWTSDHNTFAKQVAHFAPHYRTICVDLPGHGESDPVTGAAYDIAFYTQRLSAFIAALGLAQTPIIPIGHSLGGILALELAARPDAAHPLAILIDPAPLIRSPSVQRSLARTQQMIKEVGRRRTQQILGDKVFFRRTDPPELPDEVQRIAAKTDEDAAIRTWDAIVGYQAESPLQSVTVPLLFINADRPQNREEDIRALVKTLHWGRTIGTGHFNHLVMPDQVNAMIGDMLRLHADAIVGL